MAELLSIQSEMVCVSQHLFEEKPRTLEAFRILPAGAGQRLHQPESAQVKGALPSRQSIAGLFRVVAEDQPIRHQASGGRGLIDGVDGLKRSEERRVGKE